MSDASEIVQFFGRFHPLLVHLPIGFVIALAVLELLARRPRFAYLKAGAGLLLGLAVPASIISAVLGWMLSTAGGYDSLLLTWHFYTGLLVAFGCLLAAVLYWLDLKKAYRITLFFTTLTMGVAGHFGGSLTHGSDYLVRYAPGPLRSLSRKPPAPAPTQTSQAQAVFTALVQPVLDKNCVACHGSEKSKAGLRLDIADLLFKGGDSGPVVVPSQSAASLLMKRMRLPIDDEDHMPPEGKPQPSSDDLALMAWWIDSGASTNATASDLKAPPHIEPLLQARLGTKPAPPQSQATPLPRTAALAEAGRIANELGVAVSSLSENEPWLTCNASLLQTNWTDTHLARLAAAPIAGNLLWLDLAGTGITDTGLVVIARFSNLKRLHLERTAITDAGLRHLGELKNLEYLNLYSTSISDAGLAHLRSLPQLRQVYLWGSQATPKAAQELSKARVNPDQIARWEQEITALKAQIAAQTIAVDIGTTQAVAAAEISTNSAPVNTTCPISDKPVEASKTLLFEGKVYAFCCDDCLNKARQDPKAVLVKFLKP